ncbi:MAG: ferrochelatase [Alphaproteobacteria bacterium]
MVEGNGPRIAVILFNLGGPDRPDAVRPFLVNLFSDPAILRVPGPFRWILARLIAGRRAGIAKGIYEQLGGGSPLLPNTEAQARALEAHFEHGQVRAFVCMRYWHPMADEVAGAVRDWRPDRILLLPLYPQFSTTTTASSLKDWDRATRQAGLSADTVAYCCYPTLPGFVAAIADLIRPALAAARTDGPVRVLFSAHGLPKRVVEGGDPYQWQVEQTAAAVIRALDEPGLDHAVCYQSRVGPLEWIGPSTDSEIERAGRERRSVVLVPVAFVSEHYETLVELDVEYRHLAERSGVPGYRRVATVGTHPLFIEGLAGIVRAADCACIGIYCAEGGRLCPAAWAGCGLQQEGR